MRDRRRGMEENRQEFQSHFSCGQFLNVTKFITVGPYKFCNVLKLTVLSNVTDPNKRHKRVL